MAGETPCKPCRKTRHKENTTKTGCRTCKIRRLKCDEGRPGCWQCVSTARICDGYGIWGGGGNSCNLRSYISRKVTPRSLLPLPVLVTNAGETVYLDWFVSRIAKKIAGPFTIPFWDTLLLQASMTEPVILHAILTLSSVHKTNILDIGHQAQIRRVPDEPEQFMLEQYIQAIRHLRPHLSSKDKASVRVALIACVVFTSLELLRGRFKTAQHHLQSGLQVLGTDSVLTLASDHGSTDGWIAEAFSRLRIQVELFEHTHRRPSLVPSFGKPCALGTAFKSANDAWNHLEVPLRGVLCLSERAYKYRDVNALSTGYSPVILAQQKYFQKELTKWSTICEASKEALPNQKCDAFAPRLLSIYHAMVTIMANTCLRLDDESVFDSQTTLFLTIIEQSRYMWKIRSTQPRGPGNQRPGLHMDMSRSMIDVGWIPPLYYTAIKCRVQRIRQHAIGLLASASHREGLWDSQIAVCVARRVIEIEEGYIGGDMARCEKTPASGFKNSCDLQVPTLPDFCRIQEVEVGLPDGPEENISLLWRRKGAYGQWLTCSEEYDVKKEGWRVRYE